MTIKKSILISVFLLLFSLHMSLGENTANVHAASDGLDVNLLVEGCNNNNICEPGIGETVSNCSNDCSSGGSGGGSYPLPQNRKVLPPYSGPENPRFLQAVANRDGINLFWLNPPAGTFSYIRIMRNEKRYYGDPFIGRLIYEGSGQRFLDRNVLASQEYFYTLFSRDFQGNFSSGSAISATTLPTREVKLIPPIPDITEIILPPPLIKYIIYQNGQEIASLGTIKTPIADGKNSIIVSAETFIDSGDFLTVTGPNGENLGQYTFSFNQESGQYQSAIPPLQSTGIYTISIYRYNIENNPEPVINGQINISADEAEYTIVQPTQENTCSAFGCINTLDIIPILILLLLIILLGFITRIV